MLRLETLRSEYCCFTCLGPKFYIALTSYAYFLLPNLSHYLLPSRNYHGIQFIIFSWTCPFLMPLFPLD